MSEIRIDLDGVENLVREMRPKAEKILRMRSRIANLKNTLSDDVLRRRGIGGSIDRIIRELEREYENVMNLLEMAQYGVNRYRETDEALLRLFQEQTGMTSLESNSSYFRESGEKIGWESLETTFPIGGLGAFLSMGNGSGSRPESNNFGKEKVEVDWLTYLKHVEPRRSEYGNTGEYVQAMENWQRDYNRAKKLSEPIDRNHYTTAEYAKEVENREDLEKTLFKIYGPGIDAEMRKINSAETIHVASAKDYTTTSGESGEPPYLNKLPMDYKKATYEDVLRKTDKQQRFGKGYCQYTLANSPWAYTDPEGRLRYSKIPGVKDNRNDYYCMALPIGYRLSTSNQIGGWTFKMTLKGDTGETYRMDVLMLDAKASKNVKDKHPQDHVIEFITNTYKDNKTIESTSLDKMTGGKNVEFDSVEGYIDGNLAIEDSKNHSWILKY